MAKTDADPLPADDAPEQEQRGIQSVEVGGQLLLALAHSGRPMALKGAFRRPRHQGKAMNSPYSQ